MTLLHSHSEIFINTWQAGAFWGYQFGQYLSATCADSAYIVVKWRFSETSQWPQKIADDQNAKMHVWSFLPFPPPVVGDRAGVRLYLQIWFACTSRFGSLVPPDLGLCFLRFSMVSMISMWFATVSIPHLRFPRFPWFPWFPWFSKVSMVSMVFISFMWFPWFPWFLCGCHGF